MKTFLWSIGFKLGIGLVMAPIVVDLLWHGGREFNLVSIGNVGVIVQIIGLILMLISPRDAKI